eukprot:904043_1
MNIHIDPHKSRINFGNNEIEEKQNITFNCVNKAMNPSWIENNQLNNQIYIHPNIIPQSPTPTLHKNIFNKNIFNNNTLAAPTIPETPEITITNVNVNGNGASNIKSNCKHDLRSAMYNDLNDNNNA